jgi:iron complex outermembrane recepter protein
MIRRLYIPAVTLSVASLTLASADRAEAQAGAQTGSLEEIVVTARRRFEVIQDTPITMTVFNEQEIRSAGIERPQDFIALTPNVTLVETQNQGTSFVTVRGISQARNSEPSVAVLIDGVLMSNPAQFTQELFDVQQIEVLKGAQGAVYGRNAIGGAIVITTREPGEEFEGNARLGYESGPGAKVQLSGSGPLGGSDRLRFHTAVNYFDTDGHIDNVFLGEEADPFRDISARARLIWEPNERLRTDARIYYSEIDTQALYFNIVGNSNTLDVAVFGAPFDPGDVNDTSLPVRVNNPGQNKRQLSQVAFKLDYELDFGTFTSISSYDTIEEILTGDQFDFLPIEESFFYTLGSFLRSTFGLGDDAIPTLGEWDWAQSQFLDVSTFSQEFRLTSGADSRIRWIAGTYFIITDRFISTGNVADIGIDGAPAVRRTPRGTSPLDRTTFPNSWQLTYLADEQDNFAWAAFGDLGIDLSEQLELNLAARYDRDTREQTTLTPDAFLVNVPGAFQGEVRKNTWSELQPKATLRYRPSDQLTLYGGWSRGFRSGGFNQTGVGAAGVPGVGDLFDAEVADTFELGLKYQSPNGRINTNFSVFDTDAEGSYFFVFLADSSTQNLGSLDKVKYQGFEIDVTARVTDNLALFAAYGYTDSEIERFAGNPATEGNQAPLVTRDTTNAGVQYRYPLAGGGMNLLARADYQRIGRTWWEPDNVTVRNPVNLLDMRLGVESDRWSVVGWVRNAHDREYNAEYSPGGFVFKALPRRWGVDFAMNF